MVSAVPRGAAMLGGLKLGSAATPHPTLLARLQKPLILLGRNGHPGNRAWGQIAGPKFTASRLHCGLLGAAQAVAEAHQKIAPIGVSLFQGAPSISRPTGQHPGRI